MHMNEQTPGSISTPIKHLDFTVEESQCAPDDHITIANLMLQLQIAAVDHAEALGFGRTMLDKVDVYWVLSNFYIEINTLPKSGDRVTIKTWPSGSTRAIATREFTATIADPHYRPTTASESNTPNAFTATSEWMILSKSHGRAKNLHRLGLKDLPAGPRTIDHTLERLQPPADIEIAEQIKVPHSAIDVNNHVNNTEYVRWALSTLNQAWPSPPQVKSLQITYLAEAFEDDILSIAVTHVTSDSAIISATKDPDNTPVFAAHVQTK